MSGVDQEPLWKKCGDIWCRPEAYGWQDRPQRDRSGQLRGFLGLSPVQGQYEEQSRGQESQKKATACHQCHTRKGTTTARVDCKVTLAVILIQDRPAQSSSYQRSQRVPYTFPLLWIHNVMWLIRLRIGGLEIPSTGVI